MVTITPSLATETKYSLCFEEPVAKQLYIDKQFCEQNYSIEKEKNSILSEMKDELSNKVDIQDKKIQLLSTDKELLQKQSDQFKELYLKVNKEKLDMELNKTSKTTWFAAGAVSSAILGIITLFLVK